MGHISRLVAISMQLKDIGLHKIFVIKSDESTIKFLNKYKNLEFIKINKPSEIFKFSIKNEILILDGYSFSTTFLKKLKKIKNVFDLY